jgi:esterase
MGHSRGGHVAFRVAQQRPELLRRLVLAEPGGELDASFAPAAAPAPAQTMQSRGAAVAAKVAAGDIEGGMTLLVDGIDGAGAWRRLPPAARQVIRDNARTMLGQANERRQPFSLRDAQSIAVPTLFVAGADTPGALPAVLRALAAAVPGARTAVIPRATHWMFDDDPPRFCAEVLAFLDPPSARAFPDR